MHAHPHFRPTPFPSMTSPKRRPRPNCGGWRARSPRTTSAITRTTRRRSRTPSTTRCAPATPRSRRAFRQLVRKDSPSRKVGAAPAQKFKKVRHAVPMLSLGNAFAEEDVTRIRRPRAPLSASASRRRDRLHGRAEDRRRVAVAALRGAASWSRRDPRRRIRGRGRHAQRAHHRSDIPRDAAGSSVPEICEVRGEVYMSQRRFSRAQQAPGEAEASRAFANPRNSAAGSLRSSIRRSRRRGRCASLPMPGAR